MTKKKENYGHATVGVGNPNQREIAIEDYVSAFFLESRTITICTLENDEGIVILVENPVTSGRSTQQIWLSEGSFAGLFAAINLYCKVKNINPEELLKSSSPDGEIRYSYSGNLE